MLTFDLLDPEAPDNDEPLYCRHCGYLEDIHEVAADYPIKITLCPSEADAREVWGR